MRIINVMAASLDGKIAGHSLESDRERRDYGFTNKADQEFVRHQLTTADAVVTGANSLRASQGAWQVPNQKGRCATWVVLTRAGLDPSLRFWGQSEVPKWIVTPAPDLVIPADPANRLIVIPPTENPAPLIAKELKDAGYEKILLFGGGHVNRLFYEAGLVDELFLTLCPLMLGTPAASSLLAPPLSKATHFRLVSSNNVGDLVFLNYTVNKSL